MSSSSKSCGWRGRTKVRNNCRSMHPQMLKDCLPTSYVLVSYRYCVCKAVKLEPFLVFVDAFYSCLEFAQQPVFQIRGCTRPPRRHCCVVTDYILVLLQLAYSVYALLHQTTPDYTKLAKHMPQHCIVSYSISMLMSTRGSPIVPYSTTSSRCKSFLLLACLSPHLFEVEESLRV